MIRTIRGNLLTAKGIIIHGVNCEGVMGAGVALAIRRKWPKVYDEYMRTILSYKNGVATNTGDLLGSAWRVQVEDDVHVFNLFTQERIKRIDGIRYASYDAIDSALAALVAMVKEMNDIAIDMGTVINFPLIGCGLGGGHWPVVREIIEHRIPDTFTKNLWVLP